MKNNVLKRTIESLFADGDEHAGKESPAAPASDPPTSSTSESDFRTRFPPRYRTADGHMVRSRAEVMIDNWLYVNGIVHAYERRLPIEDEAYCDFYIPLGMKAFVEFWGMEEKASYRARMEEKKRLYNEHQLNLVEVVDSDLNNLDDLLPKKLLKYGIKPS